MTKEAPAPEAIVQMVKCGCQKIRCSNNQWHCRKSGLICIFLFSYCDSRYENTREDTDALKIEFEDAGSEE